MLSTGNCLLKGNHTIEIFVLHIWKSWMYPNSLYSQKCVDTWPSYPFEYPIANLLTHCCYNNLHISVGISTRFWSISVGISGHSATWALVKSGTDVNTIKCSVGLRSVLFHAKLGKCLHGPRFVTWILFGFIILHEK